MVEYDITYSKDSVNWYKLYNEYNLDNHKVNYKEDKVLDALQSYIINNQNFAMAYFFATTFDYKNHFMQKVIIDSGNPKYSFLYAKNINNADIKSLEYVIIKSNDIKYICEFVCFINGADFSKIKKIILKSKDAKYYHMFIKYFPDTDVRAFKKIIIESNKPRYLFELARHLKSQKEINEIQDLIIKLGSATYIRIFAEKIKMANVDKLEKAILKTNDAKEIKKFAKSVKKSRMRNFLLVS